MKMKTTIRALIPSALIVLAGCASPLDKFLEQEIQNNPVTVVRECLDITDKKADEMKQSAEMKDKTEFEQQTKFVDEFLDCVFDVKVDPTNLEFRLVRGHAVVAMLTMYGAFSLKYDPVNQEADAQRLLGRIVEAEKNLWAASKLSGIAPALSSEVKLLLEAKARHDRIIDVGQVATASLTPLKRRAIGFFDKLVGLVATPTPAGAISALKDIRDATKRAFIVALSGGDYITGTRSWMKNIAIKKNGKPEKLDWVAIDDAYLKPACHLIAIMAYGKIRECTPART